jgi:cytochrome c oxidase cbb3-type subunit 4
MLPEEISRLAGTWGLVYMMAIFAIAVAYALWPSNRAKFERAARLPLEDRAPPARKGDRG